MASDLMYAGFDPEIFDFGMKYGTGFGFTLEELTIFYLFVNQHKTFIEIGEFLGQYREVIRKKFVKIYRELVRQKRNFAES